MELACEIQTEFHFFAYFSGLMSLTGNRQWKMSDSIRSVVMTSSKKYRAKSVLKKSSPTSKPPQAAQTA